MERERILANARKYTYADYEAGWKATRSLALANKTLSRAEMTELGRLNRLWCGPDCPYIQPAEVKVTLMGEGIPHFDAHIQDGLWDIMWAANARGEDLDTYLDRCDSWGPLTRAALEASPPLPEGYVLSTRRGA